MPIQPELLTASQIYNRNQIMLSRAIDGLTPEQLQTRPGDASNSALWIVGHMVWARSRALKLLGVEWSAPWLNLFERGAKPADAPQYPPIQEVLAAWNELSVSFPLALEAAPAAVLSGATPPPSPSLDGTVGGMVSFLAMHESYHVGQIVYLRHLVA